METACSFTKQPHLSFTLRMKISTLLMENIHFVRISRVLKTKYLKYTYLAALLR